MLAAVYDWSGFYIGANGGWGFSRNCWDFLPVTPDVQPLQRRLPRSSGGTIGGQIGYRWQAGTWVFGVEAQGNWADFHGSNVSLFAPPHSATTRRSTRSACSLARLVMPPTTSCSTSRAVRL